jgi:hypothetical protein
MQNSSLLFAWEQNPPKTLSLGPLPTNFTAVPLLRAALANKQKAVIIFTEDNAWRTALTHECQNRPTQISSSPSNVVLHKSNLFFLKKHGVHIIEGATELQISATYNLCRQEKAHAVIFHWLHSHTHCTHFPSLPSIQTVCVKITATPEEINDATLCCNPPSPKSLHSGGKTTQEDPPQESLMEFLSTAQLLELKPKLLLWSDSQKHLRAYYKTPDGTSALWPSGVQIPLKETPLRPQPLNKELLTSFISPQLDVHEIHIQKKYAFDLAETATFLSSHLLSHPKTQIAAPSDISLCKTQHKEDCKLNPQKHQLRTTLTASQKETHNRLLWAFQTKQEKSKAYAHRKSLLILGPSGAGKSRVTEETAHVLNCAFHHITCQSWIPRAARCQPYTLDTLQEFVESHPSGIIFLDELDKMTAQTDWNLHLQEEIKALLDGRLNAMDWKTKNLEKLEQNFLIVGAGTWQSLWSRSNLGFHSQDQTQTSTDQNLLELAKKSGVPEEMLLRFNTLLCYIDPLTKEDFLTPLQEIYASHHKILTKDQEEALLTQAVNSHANYRWLESLAAQISYQTWKEKQKEEEYLSSLPMQDVPLSPSKKPQDTQNVPNP